MAFGNGPRIVTSGLVLSLDASDQNSYVSGSTTWFDLSGNNQHFNLQSTPTFTTEGNGSLTFNGTNQFASSATTFAVPSEITIISTVRRNGVPNGNFPAIFHCGSGDFTSGVGNGVIFTYPFIATDQIVYSSYGNGITSPGSTSVTWPSGSIGVLATTINSTGIILYGNGTVLSSRSVAVPTSNFTGTANIGVWGTFGRYMNGTIFNLSIYNRALTATEIAQNYNAQKSRFNLI
jgi:hypothetical protein